MLFAPVGLGFGMIGPSPATWSAGVIIAAFSGVVALGWAYAFSSRRYWVLAFVVPFSFLAPMYIFRWMGAAGLFELGSSVGPMARGITLVIMSMLLLSGGFILLVKHIRGVEDRAARHRAELDVARRMHEQIVPAVQLRNGSWTVYGLSAASDTMGGDLIDVIERGGELDVFLADVSGHGVGAGIVMGMLKASIRTRLLARDQARGLGDILTDLNRVLFDLTRPEMFATMASLRLHADGRAEYALAGHLPILHWRSAAKAWARLENAHLPLGVDDVEAVSSGQVSAGAGDLFVLYTDGLVEIQDRAGRELGLEGFAAIVERSRGEDLPGMHRAVLDGVDAFAGGARAMDDQTLLLVAVNGARA